MSLKRVVRVRSSRRSEAGSYSLLRCEECNSLLVTAGEFRAGMIKCPLCKWAWSIGRLGLKIVDGEYYFDR